jgi:hypothetical protein
MIVIHDHCIVIAGKTLAVVGKKIVPLPPVNLFVNKKCSWPA